MSKKKTLPPPVKKPPAATRGSGVAVAVVLKTLLAVVLVALMIGGLGYLGTRSADRLARRERYAVPVADIQVEVPPFLDKSTFLLEVRYLGELPEKVVSISPKLDERLRAAFGRHPWVADVTAVTVSPEMVIQVGLVFRKPVLRVTLQGEPGPRAVDATGILLPASAKTDGLPVLENIQPPAILAGQPFPTPDVKQAAELVGTYPTATIERTKDGWRLTAPDGKVRAIVSN